MNLGILDSMFNIFVCRLLSISPQLNNSDQMIIPFMFYSTFRFLPVSNKSTKKSFEIKCVGYVWKNDDKQSPTQHMANVRNTYFSGQLLVDKLQAKYLIKDVHNIFSLLIYFCVEDKLIFSFWNLKYFRRNI